ncbi:MAG: hypothetical protein QOG15_151 [Solirubrobacteraceae bacterium]|nr:hypothetical protein [Solirubrobacteraceae bacterium]
MLTILASSATTGILTGVAGIAVVLAISAAFYVVGRGEDRARAADRRASPDDDAPQAPQAPDPSEPREPRRPEIARRRRPRQRRP